MSVRRLLSPERAKTLGEGLGAKRKTRTPKFLGVDFPFFPTIVLFKTQLFSLGFRRFSRRKDPWKEWGRYCVFWVPCKPIPEGHPQRRTQEQVLFRCPPPLAGRLGFRIFWGKLCARGCSVHFGGPPMRVCHFSLLGQTGNQQFWGSLFLRHAHIFSCLPFKQHQCLLWFCGVLACNRVLCRGPGSFYQSWKWTAAGLFKRDYRIVFQDSLVSFRDCGKRATILLPFWKATVL